MPIVRRTFLVIAAAAAVFFLIATAIDAGVVRVVGSPQPIKRTLAGSGIFLVVFSLAFNKIMDNKVVSQISFSNRVLQQDVRELVSDIIHRISNSFLAFGGGYSILGALAVSGYFLIAKVPKKQ